MNAVVALSQSTSPVRVHSSSVLADPVQFEMNMRAAEVFAKSDLVPAHYKGKPGNCFIAINRAQRLGVDELYFLEKTYVLSGKLGMAAELAIELANSSGRFKAPMTFRLFGDGDGRGCTASAILAATGEVVENTVTYAMAKADGWTKNSKWQSLRDQMLQYRAGVFLARLYAGGAMGGLYTKEELEDIQQPAPIQVLENIAGPQVPLLNPPAGHPDHRVDDNSPLRRHAVPAPEPERLSGSQVLRVEKPAAEPLWERKSYRLPTKKAGQTMPLADWAAMLEKAADAAPSWKAWVKLLDDNIAMVEAVQASPDHADLIPSLDGKLQEKFLRPDDDVSGEPAPEAEPTIPF